MSEQDDILSFGQEGGGRAKLSEEKLMAYLDGQLSPGEQHEIEQWLAEEGMESDALEGLHGQKAADTKQTINRLNHSLRKTIHNKKRRRKPLPTNQFSWIAVLVILLLTVIAYIVIRKMTHN